MPVAYEELAVGEEPIRKGKKMRMNNNDNDNDNDDDNDKIIILIIIITIFFSWGCPFTPIDPRCYLWLSELTPVHAMKIKQGAENEICFPLR